tara:strand:+ start:170 stop:502 length:333 start_codon:yes stop_codon:yes gene_type:complete
MHNPILKNIIGEKPLSERELEIGNFLAAGLSDNEISSKLSITPDTVRFHLKNIYKKMGINGRRGLLKKYSINSYKYKNLLEKYIALQNKYLKTTEDFISHSGLLKGSWRF